MTYRLLLLLLFPLPIIAQQNSNSLNDKQVAAVMEKLHQQPVNAADRKDAENLAAALQTASQQSADQLQDYKKAIQYIDKAIAIDEAIADTMAMALDRKYKAHILVKMDKAAAAKVEIRTAMGLYRMKNVGAGIASAQLDMSRVFEYEEKPDSAIYYAEQARNFWKAQPNNLQLLIINNLLVYQLLKMSQAEKAEAVFRDSETLLKTQPAHWQPEIDFYFTSMLLFRQLNDANLASQYRGRYITKVDSLKQQGINARSYYELISQQ